MKESVKETLIGAVIVVCVCLAFVGLLQYTMTNIPQAEYTTIDSEIIDTQPIIGEDGELEYIWIVFENGDYYKVKIKDDTDLTVNSEMIIELQKEYFQDIFRNKFYKDSGEYYTISKIVKVPSD